MIRKALLIFVVGVLYAQSHASKGSEEEVSCSYINPPDIIKLESWLAGSEAQIDRERANLSSHKAGSEAYLIYEEAINRLRWNQHVKLAQIQILNNNANGYSKSVEVLQQLLDSESDEYSYFDLLILDVLASDQPGLVGFDHEVIKRAIEYMQRNRSEHDLFNMYSDVASSLYSIILSDSADYLQAFRDAQDLKSSYYQAFLKYKKAINNNSVGLYQDAIDTIQAGLDGKVFEACQPAVVGKLNLYLSDALHQLGELMSKDQEKYSDQDVERVLHSAKTVADRTSRYFDPMYVPGLWSRSYSQKAGIYESLMPYAKSWEVPRFEAINNRASHLATIY